MEGYTEASGCLSLVNSSEWWHPPPITAFETWRLVAACRALTSQASAVLSGTRESVREESHQAHIFAAASGGMTLHCSQNCTIIEKTHSTKQKPLPSANPLHWSCTSSLHNPSPPHVLLENHDFKSSLFTNIQKKKYQSFSFYSYQQLNQLMKNMTLYYLILYDIMWYHWKALTPKSVEYFS